MFESDGAKVGGTGGCNGYGGTYELDVDKLKFLELMTTLMYCNEQINDQEEEYLAILQAAESYEIKGDKLTINSGDNVLIYTKE